MVADVNATEGGLDVTETTGYLSIILHAHLPFIRHPEYDTFLEENWLFEAITDCYIPLLDVFAGLARDNVPWRLTMSLTPPLAAMLTDDLLMDRYDKHIAALVDLAEREVERTRSDPPLHRLACMYRDRFAHSLHAFNDVHDRNLVAAFGRWQRAGQLEIIASAATHGYLPLMEPGLAGAATQIDVGIEAYRRAFGQEPAGFWLPECGFNPPLDSLLADRGIRWFTSESHAVLHARPRPPHGVHAPIVCPRPFANGAGSGPAVFPRDTESSKQVWSATEGYPGDYDYRDFYRDIGFDLDYDYVRPWLKADVRGHTGVKYYRITGPGADKQLYEPEAATAKAALHAGNFMFNREVQARHLRGTMDRPPLIVAPYDAELFGHWWFEGPQWLDFLIRKIAYDQTTLRLITPSDYLAMHTQNHRAQPSPSSWGYGGYNEVWLNESNDWIYRHLHAAERTVHTLAMRIQNPTPLVRRALTQALRELLLAQSSDWAFIMSADTHVSYAVRRTEKHLTHCRELCRQVETDSVDEAGLADLESRHNIFPWLDYTVLRDVSATSATEGRHAPTPVSV